MKGPKPEPLPARSDEMMAYLASMTPVEVRVGGRVFVTTLAKLEIGGGHGNTRHPKPDA